MTQAVQLAYDGFVQSAYDLGLQLALGDGPQAAELMRETWMRLTRLRNSAAPRKLTDAAAAVSAGPRAAVEQRIEALRKEIAAVSPGTDVKDALDHIDAALAAARANKMDEMQAHCNAAVDVVVGKRLGIHLDVIVDGLRRARRVLGDNPSPRQMLEARQILRALPGADKLRQMAFEKGLHLADDYIASSADLYTEFQFRNAQIQASHARTPLMLAAQASGDQSIARQLDQVARSLSQADQLIVREVNWDNSSRIEGLRLLREARSTIAKLLEQQVRSKEMTR
jgi:hypothetical protein